MHCNPTLEKSEMAEAQKFRDKKMRKIRTSNGYSNQINQDRIDRIKCMEDIIQDLECHGPAGLIHICVLSDIIGKPIRVWNADGSLNSIIGKRKTGEPIDVEYHKTDSEQIGQLLDPLNSHPIHFLNSSLGHWTLKCGKDPDNVSIDLNSCLFSVIGSQIGESPSKLRKWTVLKLKSHFRKGRLADRIDKILKLEKNGKIILLIGGARYCGTSPDHAGVILDQSEGRLAHGHGNPGHPRGHAVHPSPPNVQTYSQRGWKTAFLSRDDQNYVVHLALTTQQAKAAMDRLNRGATSEAIDVLPSEMNHSESFPRGREFEGGIATSNEKRIRSVFLLLRHHSSQYNNPDADVFVQTCYPRLN
ncbi:uncharacterized protein LOC114943227 [Nylanderia fulva]|uniref:uncharacterized protein LOC114943227 n=1 Tax=Nylanderia fulva TaxID=613905 RepID=UPI0010FB4A81|nr:uncharacterized protein LOC114943227 [Nylanderia fulva]